MKFLIYAVILLGLGAAFTKPTPEKVEALLKAQTLETIQNTDVNLSDMGVDGALTTLCKLQPNGCWDVIMGFTTITHEDRYVYAKVGIEGLGEPQVCYAAFRQLVCF